MKAVPQCELCGAPANVHITEVALEGSSSQRSLCESCAAKAGFPVNRGLTTTIKQIRRMARFIRTNNRMPSRAEISQMGGAGELPAQPGSIEFNEQLRYLEALADFMDEHGRMPTDDELPDPF